MNYDTGNANVNLQVSYLDFDVDQVYTFEIESSTLSKILLANT